MRDDAYGRRKCSPCAIQPSVSVLDTDTSGLLLRMLSLNPSFCLGLVHRPGSWSGPNKNNFSIHEHDNDLFVPRSWLQKNDDRVSPASASASESSQRCKKTICH